MAIFISFLISISHNKSWLSNKNIHTIIVKKGYNTLLHEHYTPHSSIMKYSQMFSSISFLRNESILMRWDPDTRIFPQIVLSWVTYVMACMNFIDLYEQSLKTSMSLTIIDRALHSSSSSHISSWFSCLKLLKDGSLVWFTQSFHTSGEPSNHASPA